MLFPLLFASGLAVLLGAFQLDYRRRRARTRQVQQLAADEALSFAASGLPTELPVPDLISPPVRVRFTNCCWGQRNGYRIAAFDFAPLYRGETSGSIVALQVGTHPIPLHTIRGYQLFTEDGWVYARPDGRSAQLSLKQIRGLWDEMTKLVQQSRARSAHLLEKAQATSPLR